MFSLAVYRKVVLFHSKLWILNAGCKKPSSRLLSRPCLLRAFPEYAFIFKSPEKKINQRNAEQAKPIICKTT